MRRVAIIASASGNGKTTLGRALAARLGVRFVELDALVHGPDWAETPDEELQRMLAPILGSDDGWVIDGTYQRKLGTRVFDAADTLVWLDLPLWIWLPRLVRRSWRRRRGAERLWNDNRETLRDLFWGRESLVGYALRSHFRRRRKWPAELAGRRVVRLHTPAEVERWLAGVGRQRPRPVGPARP